MIFFKVSKLKKGYQVSWRVAVLDNWTVEDIFSDWRDIPRAKVAIIEREKSRLIIQHENYPEKFVFPKNRLDELNKQIGGIREEIKIMARNLESDVDYTRDATDFQQESERGWWELKVDGISELSDNGKEHIADLIRMGYTSGEIIQ